jgi:hypothetical protein
MSIEFNEIMFFGIPESYYRVLNLWAVERNFRSSGHNFTAEKIAAEIICEFIDEAEQMELRLQPDDVDDRDQEAQDNHSDGFKRSEGSLPTPDIEQE